MGRESSSSYPESGVYNTPFGPSLVTLVRELRRLIASGTVGLVVRPSCGEECRARLLPSDRTLPSMLPKRMADWLLYAQVPQEMVVPHLMLPWLPPRVMVVPMHTPVWLAGWMLIDAHCCDPSLIKRLVSLAGDIALRIESADRQYQLRSLRQPTVVRGIRHSQRVAG